MIAQAGLSGYSVDEIKGLMSYLDDEERLELIALMSKGNDVWYSLPGVQSDARYNEADITGYGGAAGGGKTDLGCGLAIVDHDKTTIFRNELSQLEAVKERFEEIIGTRNGFNGQTNVWKLGLGRRVRFGGFPNPGDERKYQGNPNDLIVFEEAAEMREQAVRFVVGWNRAARKGRAKRRTRILMTFNPPTRPEGRWIIGFFAPWLDKRHPMYPTKPGELRWATTDPEGKDHWLVDGREFVWVAGKPCYDFNPADYAREAIIKPMSRTFIPARLADNPYLNDGDYLARLQQFPEPLRSQMLYGDFEAGMQDDEWQVIPTSWIQKSMARWKAAVALGPAFKRGPMSSMGVDVARGGRDKFVIAPRYSNWFGDLIRYPGKGVTNGNIGAGLVIKHRANAAPVHVDVIGYGASTHDALVGQGVQSLGVNVGSGSMRRALSNQMAFVNLRAELVWRLREALDPENEDAVMLPDDLDLELDLAAYRWFPAGGKIQIASKDEMKKRIGRSPDDGDAVCLGLMDTMKAETFMEMIDDQMAAKVSSDPFNLWFGGEGE